MKKIKNKKTMNSEKFSNTQVRRFDTERGVPVSISIQNSTTSSSSYQLPVAALPKKQTSDRDIARTSDIVQHLHEPYIAVTNSSVLPRNSSITDADCTDVSTSFDRDPRWWCWCTARVRPRQSFGVLLPVLFAGLRSPGVAAGWYVVAMASAQEVLNGLMWATFGPIARTAEAVFDWGDPMIALIGGVPGVFIAFCSLPAAWLIEHIGLRPTLLATGLVHLVGLVAQALPLSAAHNSLRDVFCVFNAVCIGIGAALVQTAPSTISMTWIRPHHRTLATALQMLANQLGVALGFFLGPMMVPDITHCNDEISQNSTNASFNCKNGMKRALLPEDISSARSTIDFYLMWQAMSALMLFLIILFYLPERPLDAPSVAASTERHQFFAGVKAISKMKSVWLVLLNVSLVWGVMLPWATLLPIILRPLGVSQSTTGLIGTYALLVCAAGSFIFGLLQDILKGYMKSSMILLNAAGATGFTIFCLMAIGFIPFHTVILYVSLVAGIALPQSSLPIGYEFSAELSFPVHESVANGLLLFTAQFISTAFYIAFAVVTYGSISTPSILVHSEAFDKQSLEQEEFKSAELSSETSVFEAHAELLWWFSAATCLIAALALLPVTSRYRRLALDQQVQTKPGHKTNTSVEKSDWERDVKDSSSSRISILRLNVNKE